MRPRHEHDLPDPAHPAPRAGGLWRNRQSRGCSGFFEMLSPSGRRRRASGSRQSPFCLAAAAAVPTFFLAACDTSRPLELQSDMSFDGAVRLEGPITIQMSGPETRYSGTFVSKDLFNEIEVGKSTRLWVVTVLGEPDRRSELQDGSELLVWAYRVGAIAGQMVDVIDIGGNEGKQPATLTTVVRFVDGIVKEKWRG
jgi:hypothetical protein